MKYAKFAIFDRFSMTPSSSSGSLWSKIEKNTDKIPIQLFTVPRAREWAKWASERTSERSGGRERSEQSGASERVSGACERVNGRASGPVLTSRFLVVPDHCAFRTLRKEPLIIIQTPLYKCSVEPEANQNFLDKRKKPGLVFLFLYVLVFIFFLMLYLFLFLLSATELKIPSGL